jgi:hypothetical protein
VTVRVTSALLVNALVRQAFADGGSAAILFKGDEGAGAILLVMAEKGVISGLWERIPDPVSGYTWAQKSTQVIDNQQVFGDYLARRRANDPDLWVVEVDVADAPRFAALMPSGA